MQLSYLILLIASVLAAVLASVEDVSAERQRPSADSFQEQRNSFLRAFRSSMGSSNGKPSFIRFGKRAGPSFIRFGKRASPSFIRFGRSSPDHF